MGLQLTRIHWVALTIVFFLIGVYLNFESATFEGMLISAFIFAVILFCIIFFIARFVNEKECLKMLGVLGVGVFVLAFYSFFVWGGSLSCSFTAANHFRTNTLTEECDFGGGGLCTFPGDPWYYEDSCASDELKTNAIKGTYFYQESLRQCEQACTLENQTLFCGNTIQKEIWQDAPPEVDCAFVTSCPQITCS
jgi:hypothetical protein